MVTCPNCGSTSTKQKPPQVGEGFVIVRDHVCQSCQYEFQPPIPKWAAPVLLVAGVSLAVTAVALIVWFLVSTEQDKWRNVRGIAILALILLGAGAGMLVTALKLKRGEDNDNRIF